MLKKISGNPVALFFAKAFGLFLLWYVIYELWLHPMGLVDAYVIDNIIFFSSKLLNALGYELIKDPEPSSRTIGIDGTHGLWVGDPCNGITLFALFTGFIIAYPGPIIRKLWYIPLGLILIHFLNILRVAALTLIDFHSPSSLAFNHTYTFTILVYSFVFFLWIIWANKLSVKT